jgi:radical SAM protein with 4Fe4S-binding SPASM domain
METFKISKKIFEIELKAIGDFNHIALYHSTSMDVIYIKKAIYENIKNKICDSDYIESNRHITDSLIQKKFIVPCETDEDKDISKTIELINIMNPSTLRLQLTEACNLNCTYCQIERNYKQNNQAHMNEDIAIRSLKLFAKHAPKKVQKTIILTGGEPLLNFKIIELLFVLAKEILDSYRFILFTNGTKITEQMAKIFKDNNVLVLISLDGNEKQHDLSRKDFLERGSFNDALRGYFICKKNGCNIGISGVIGMHNIAELDNEVIKFFIDIDPDSLGLNYPHYLLNEDNTRILPMANYTDAIIATFKKLRGHGVYLENINRVIEPFVKQKINAKECAALGRGITVLPNGVVGPCKTLLVAGIIGISLDEIEKVEKLDDDAMFHKWCNRSTYTLESCKGCIGISLCGSGCTYDSYVINGNIDGIDKRICIFIKKIIEFLINDLYRLVQDRGNSDIIIPSLEDRQKIYSSIIVNENDLKRSAGHEI